MSTQDPARNLYYLFVNEGDSYQGPNGLYSYVSVIDTVKQAVRARRTVCRKPTLYRDGYAFALEVHPVNDWLQTHIGTALQPAAIG